MASVPRLLGVDPGFVATGWCVAEPFDGHPLLLDVGVIRTSPNRGARLYVTVDDIRRWEEIVEGLVALVDKWDARVVCAEMPGGSQSSRAATALAYARTAVSAARRALPLAWVQPSQVKLALTGRKSASKEEVVAATLSRYPGLHPLMPKSAGLWEHVADAVGAVLAAYDHEVVRAVRAVRTVTP